MRGVRLLVLPTLFAMVATGCVGDAFAQSSTGSDGGSRRRCLVGGKRVPCVGDVRGG